jgi:hypothetical protein
MPADELPIVPEIVPALMICQIVPEPPLTASTLAVVVMLPALVIVKALRAPLGVKASEGGGLTAGVDAVHQ